MNHLATIGPAIAKHLPGWKYVHLEEYHAAYLIPENTTWKRYELAIHLSADTYKKRIHVSGCWPVGVTPRDIREESPSINVGLDRDPKRIAADIQRRFLPKYLDLYRKCAAQAQHNTESENSQKAVAQEFAKLAGTTTDSGRVHFYRDDCYGDVEINWGGETASLVLRGDVAILKRAIKAALEKASCTG